MFRRHCITGLLLCGLLFPGIALPGPFRQGGARDYLVHTWQTDDGLPQNWVSSIAQTPDGYLWIGTRYGGLARFDGVRFVSFNQQNTPALKDVQVEHLTVDDTGRLWIIMGNESITAMEHERFELTRRPRNEPRLRADRALTVGSNEVIFAGENDYLARIQKTSQGVEWQVLRAPPGYEPDPRTFTPKDDGVIWFVTRNQRLARFTGTHFDLTTDTLGLPGPRVVSIDGGPRDELWAATPRRLLCWDGSRFQNATPSNGPAPVGIQQVVSSRDGGCWVLESGRIRKALGGEWVTVVESPQLREEIASGTFHSQDQGRPISRKLFADSEGNLWFITYGRGLWHVKSNGQVRHLSEASGLPNDYITCWFEDVEGNVWIGTAGGGIARIRESFFRALGQADGLPGKVVRSVCIDNDGQLWAGLMAGGLARWEGGKFARMHIPQAPSIQNVTVYPAKEGGVWIGSINHELMLYRDSHFETVTRASGSLLNTRFLFDDSQGRLWAGRLVSLFQLDQGQFRQLGSAEGFVDSQAVESLAEDATGAIWIGTGPGELWKFESGRFSRFNPPADWPSVRFSSVLPDTNGVVWVGTLGGGLMRFENGQFTRCTSLNGLPDDNIPQLLDSGDGHLWGGTYAGIFRASKADLTAVASGRAARLPCRVYGRFDGLPALECSSGFHPACWRASSGQLYFSTANGIVTFNPQEITPNQNPPRVIIEELTVNGKPRPLPPQNALHSSTLKNGASLQIEPGRHFVQFRFTGLNFTAPDGVRFRVKLEGSEQEWRDIGGQRSMPYGPLPPGHYRFHVIACNNDEVWNAQGDSLAFTVLPHFWETWWFQALLAATALTTLGITVAVAQRRRYRRKLERVERQREMERERTRIARDLHDDLGTSLTQISMLSALANRDQTPPSEARDLIQQVRGRAREMVTALDEIVWAVNPRNDSLSGLASYLGHFAEQFYRPTRIRCRLDIPADVPTRPLSAEMRHHLFLAFKEALNNAARHADATQVSIQVAVRENELVITVEDDGRGFDMTAAKESGNGLANMKLRIEQLGGSIRLESAPGRGTVVTFQAPLPPEAPAPR